MQQTGLSHQPSLRKKLYKQGNKGAVAAGTAGYLLLGGRYLRCHLTLGDIMTARTLDKVRSAGASFAVALALILSGCAAETTFAGFSDEQMKALLPTEAEVASAVPGKVSLGDPIATERTPASPGDSPGRGELVTTT